ncbi:MAG: hypothetical protein QOE01_3113 [Actinomycetota bacterium]|jgi:hypothetical protein|nr:hypothetical protein [Actinomycetota bacterium]
MKSLGATDQQLRQQLQSQSPLSGLGGQAKASPYEDSTFVGQKYTFSGVPLGKLNQSSNGDQLSIKHQGSSYVVNGTLDLSTGQLNGSGLGSAQIKQFLKSADIRVELTFPGKVRSASGSIDGNSVTWTPKFGDKVSLKAVADDSSSSGGGASSAVWIILLVVLLLLALAVGFVLMRRRSAAPVAAGPGPAYGAGEGAAGTELPGGESPTTPIPQHPDAGPGPSTAAPEPSHPDVGPAPGGHEPPSDDTKPLWT